MSIQLGIRAVSSEGTRFRATSNQLNKDNYTQWSARLNGIIMVNKVWDIVNEDRIRPPRQAVHELGVEVATPEAIAAASAVVDKYDRYLEDYTRAACLLAESIFDAELVAITRVLDDPVAIWTKLQRKFARVSELEKSAAQNPSFSFSIWKSKLHRKRYPSLRLWWPNACNKRSVWRMTSWSVNSLIDQTIGVRVMLSEGLNGEINHYRKRELHELIGTIE